MTCILQIDVKTLQYPIPYKYVIYSQHRSDCYEHLHGYSWSPNRCLQFAPSKYLQAVGGMYDISFSLCIHLPSTVLVLHTLYT